MADRKVLNKYYPPDFDPSLIRRPKKMKNKQQTVNMMMPMSVTCNTCGEYIYRGTKFNSKKETVQGEDYLGIKIFRFYMRCPNCSAEFTIKTDPKNAEYAPELNCTRQFEPWRQDAEERERAAAERDAEERGDAMKELENKTVDSKLEMDILDGLEEIRAANARQAHINLDDLLAQRKEENEKLAEDDERQLEEVFGGGVKRIKDEDDEDDLAKQLMTRRKKKPATELPVKVEQQEIKQEDKSAAPAAAKQAKSSALKNLLSY